jgi:tetratricopeptide (TPR) repeat protein
MITQGPNGGIVIEHAGQVAIFQGIPQAAARSAYLKQVERIAPPDPPGVRDRDAERAELGRFCLDPDGASYLWWRAGPWAGKSALLSTFVLHPPAEVAGRVRIVSFFITARLAAQDTREAFAEVLLEQLASLLGQAVPPVLPEATREAYLLGLLSSAASACQEEGSRLVLVVDGLDEDRGVTTGPDTHSIAGLLPARPPAGMRVIVAGRPNPPIPDDVPDWHPLRDPAIIRPLPASSHARDVQRLARQELRRLLHGSPAEQDLLGLLVAACGGLSVRDLADLGGVRRWEAEDILHTVAGRTFTSRPGFLTPRDRPDVYLLQHEELQAAATDYLGDRLPRYHERLHSWAARYRARQWPPETPEYLLAGYFRLLDDLGDLPRMTEFARDLARHDRMLSLTGSDAAALAEARTALDRITAQDDPDLATALALACHRDHVADRNARIPASPSRVWAQVAAALAQAGQHQQAEAIARSITSPDWQASALAQVAAALAGAGKYQQAEAIARSITSPDWQMRALAQVAGALAGAGRHQQAEAIPMQAEALARSIAHPGSQASALAQVAGALAGAGRHQQAEALAMEAEALARSITNPGSQAHALAQVAGALARAGRHQQAEALARSIAHPGSQAHALAQVAGALAGAGRHQQAEALARSIAHPGSQAHALAQVAGALAGAGRHQQAEALARSITNPGSQAHALGLVAGALARAGEARSASRVAAATCAVGRWTTAVRPVLLLVPSAFTMLARTLQEQQQPPQPHLPWASGMQSQGS